MFKSIFTYMRVKDLIRFGLAGLRRSYNDNTILTALIKSIQTIPHWSNILSNVTCRKAQLKYSLGLKSRLIQLWDMKD